MKQINLIRAVVIAASLGCSFAQANDIEPGKEFYTAIKAANPIVLDGDLSEWTGAAVLADPRFSVPKGSGDDGELVFFEIFDGGGPGDADWTGPDDQTSAVQVVYDDDNVYFGFTVTDEYHENAANSAWNGDSVQLMIANETRDAQVALYNYALSGTESELGEIIVNHEAGPGGTEAVVVRNTETKRTTYEIQLPKEALALETLGGGVQFGLGMSINDGDEAAPGQQGWGGLGAHAIVFGKSPSETALVTLATSNDIEPGKEFYSANPAPGEITIDGDLSEWVGTPVLSDPRFAIPKGEKRNGELVLFEVFDGGGPGDAVWTGPDDHTSAVQIVYDADNVYFGFTVTDEYHENAANSAWNGDSVQLMIAGAKQDTQVALYNYALGGVEGELGEVIVNHESGPGGTEAVVTRNAETKRTIYEIKLPKEALALETLELGTQFGLGMSINDGDEAAPGQQGWGGLGAHAIVFGKSPSETALVTLSVGGVGGDSLFFSAVNASLDGFAFRANDKGDSVVDPNTAKLIVDGVELPLEASDKKVDAIDFSHNYGTLFLPQSVHSFTIELTDTNGAVVSESGTFSTPSYGILTPSLKAASVDRSEPGFQWRVWQSDLYVHTNLDETELALVGELEDAEGFSVDTNDAFPGERGPALADGVVDGSILQYEIPTVINLARLADEMNGNFTPDDQMPGIPGLFDTDSGISAEIITYVDLPQGWTEFGVTVDDAVRAHAGPIDDADNRALLTSFNSPRAASTQRFPVFTQEGGVYPLRFIYQNGGGGASIEIYTIAEDGSLALLNDTDNGGLASFRSGAAPSAPATPDPILAPPGRGVPTVPMLPSVFSLGVTGTDGGAEITWDVIGLTLQSSTDLVTWTDVPGASSPFTPASDAGAIVFYRLRQ